MMAYNSVNDTIVLFGGAPVSGNYFGDTQVFHCSTSTWTQLNPSPAPSARYGHSMVYDSARNEVILFGGRLVNSNGLINNETWAFDGTSWQQRTPVNSPSIRYLPSATYDSGRARIVLFGGADPSQVLSDTWEWDGTNWSLRASTIPSPNPNRYNSAIAYDPIRQRTVIFGGRYNSTILGGTLLWDGTAWTNVTPASSNPPNRTAAALSYDSALDRVVLFGGRSSAGGTNYQNDTWYWSGVANTWTQTFPGTPPLPRDNSGFVYDTLRERHVLFGGGYNDLWAFASATPASLSTFGTGCSGAGPNPTLATADHRRPWLGDSYALSIGGISSNGLYVLVTGTSTLTWNGLPLPLPLAPLGMPGCSALVSPELFDAGIYSSGGTATITLPLVPAAAGLSIYHQALVLYPTAPNPFGGLASHGVEARLGLR